MGNLADLLASAERVLAEPRHTIEDGKCCDAFALATFVRDLLTREHEPLMSGNACASTPRGTGVEVLGYVMNAARDLTMVEPAPPDDKDVP